MMSPARTYCPPDDDSFVHVLDRLSLDSNPRRRAPDDALDASAGDAVDASAAVDALSRQTR